MIHTACPFCNNAIEANMYFHDQGIAVNENYATEERVVFAHVKGRAICPICGAVFEKTFKHELTKADIMGLALSDEYVD